MLIAAADLQVSAACFVILMHIHIYADLPFAQQIIDAPLTRSLQLSRARIHIGKAEPHWKALGRPGPARTPMLNLGKREH